MQNEENNDGLMSEHIEERLEALGAQEKALRVEMANLAASMLDMPSPEVSARYAAVLAEMHGLPAMRAILKARLKDAQLAELRSKDVALYAQIEDVGNQVAAQAEVVRIEEAKRDRLLGRLWQLRNMRHALSLRENKLKNGEL